MIIRPRHVRTVLRDEPRRALPGSEIAERILGSRDFSQIAGCSLYTALQRLARGGEIRYDVKRFGWVKGRHFDKDKHRERN